MAMYDNCADCMGHGYFRCVACACTSCESSGKVKCSDCEDGKVPCELCDATGQIAK